MTGKLTLTMAEINKLSDDEFMQKFRDAGFPMSQTPDDRAQFSHVFLHARQTGVSKLVAVNVTTDYGKRQITFEAVAPDMPADMKQPKLSGLTEAEYAARTKS